MYRYDILSVGDDMFSRYLKTKQITFKHAKGCRDIFGKEFHAFNEIFLLIGDTAEFTSDNLIDKISANSLVIIPKHQFHQFDHIGKEENYHRFVLQFDNIPSLNENLVAVLDRVKLIHNISAKTLLLFKNMELLLDEKIEQCDKEALLEAYFTELIIDLKYNYTNAAITERAKDLTVLKIVEYINENFLNDISIATITKHFNFSETYISHKFKNVMHISIYKYILQKKLLYAHELICSGTPATVACDICGFNEYSGFYKIYKKHFGFSPAKTNKKS